MCNKCTLSLQQLNLAIMLLSYFSHQLSLFLLGHNAVGSWYALMFCLSIGWWSICTCVEPLSLKSRLNFSAVTSECCTVRGAIRQSQCIWFLNVVIVAVYCPVIVALNCCVFYFRNFICVTEFLKWQVFTSIWLGRWCSWYKMIILGANDLIMPSCSIEFCLLQVHCREGVLSQTVSLIHLVLPSVNARQQCGWKQ